MKKNVAVSMSRGIAILLMVLSHSSVVTGYANSCVYLFHMPLFFIMSGICFKDEYLNDAGKFTLRKIEGIYLPTVCFGLIFLALHNVFFRLNLYNDIYGYAGNVSYLYGKEHFVKRTILLLCRVSASEELLGGYWFMYTLFFASFIYYALRRLIKNEYAVTVILFFSAVLLKMLNLKIPFLLIGSREFVASTLISIGHIGKNYIHIHKYDVPVTIIGIVLLALGGVLWPSDMNN